MRIASFSVVLLAGYSCLCAAQTTPLRTVTGSVLNSATNEPIRRALVAVGPALVLTGADGRFQAENIPDGQIMVWTQKPGYFDCASVGCSLGSHATTIVTVQSGANEVLLKLVPESAVEGRILDQDGEPVGNIKVTALGERFSNGIKQYAAQAAVTTDETGSYRIEGLISGSYMVKTTARAAFYLPFTGSIDVPQEMYPQRYYPNTPDMTSAQILQLKPGQTASADFTLPRVAAVRISGSVAPVLPNISSTAEDASGDEMYLQARFQPQTGKFAAFLPAGSWTLHFGAIDGQGGNFTATETITATKNVDNLRIVLQPLASIPLNIVNASGTADTQFVSVSLLSREKREPVGFFNTGRLMKTAQTPDAIANVPPGKYSVLVSAANQCLDSLTSGNVDLLQNDLVVLPGSQPQPINLVLRNDCATLQVSVHSEDPSARSFVLLVPSSRAILPITMQLEPGASATLGNLSPGEYQVYAFSNIDGLEYANPEVMREYSGQQLTLAPNQHANVTVNMIAR